MHVVSLLSVVWFSLCTALVAREADLIVVFISFVLSFSLAYALIGVGALLGVLRGKRKKANITKSSYHARVKHTVAVIVCLLVTAFLLISDYSIEKIPQVGQLVSNQRFSIQYYCLGIVAGYLIFELWYDQMYCTLNPTPIVSLMEAAATLSFLCVILYRWRDCFAAGKVAIHHDAADFFFSNNRILLWLLYKITRSLFNIFGLRILIGKHRLIETKILSADTDKVAEATKGPLWIIHGEMYDLSDFIERHPGGREAILLGRGRDCTALFESYHPFTNKHRYVEVIQLKVVYVI